MILYISIILSLIFINSIILCFIIKKISKNNKNLEYLEDRFNAQRILVYKMEREIYDFIIKNKFWDNFNNDKTLTELNIDLALSDFEEEE